METTETTIESLIAAVLCDLRQHGYSSVQPFCIGKVEKRMMLFAQNIGNLQLLVTYFCQILRQSR